MNTAENVGTNNEQAVVAAVVKPNVIKGVTFGGIKSAKKESGRKTYPIFKDDEAGSAAALAEAIVELHEKVEKFDLAKKMLGEMVTQFYFTNASGKVEVPSSVEVESKNGNVLVTFQNRYKAATDLERLSQILGGRVESWFKQGFSIKVDGDKIPVQHAQALIDELQTLFDKYDAVEALSATDSMKPLPTFHQQRHLDLTVEQNMAVQEVCSVVVVVKPAAGRKAGRIDPTKA